jgi:outer membrane protein assembly factor BamE (lipoprotein component of BamABCDE complex)
MLISMKIMRTVLAVTVASLLLAGCATTFKPWQLSEVQEGMDRDQVVKILGEPDYTVNKDGSEYLYYSYEEEPPVNAAPSIEGQDNIERRAEELSRVFNEIKYEIVMVDGKLINYKELQN